MKGSNMLYPLLSVLYSKRNAQEKVWRRWRNNRQRVKELALQEANPSILCPVVHGPLNTTRSNPHSEPEQPPKH